ncbi:MAG: hypothetical protein HY751_05235 [Nitrospinae bacterium]|nr:hypothetical protein [Nitrospinota bacterium]
MPYKWTMFIGHYGAAMAAKKLAPKASLGALIMAAQFIDLIWPPLLLLGIEKARITPGITEFTPLDFYFYPYSHSLLMTFIWACAFGGIYFAIRKNTVETLVLCALVMSHWALDFLVHRPDLPLAPGVDIFYGLGLWNSVAGTLAVELSMFLAGAYLYYSSVKPLGKSRAIGFFTVIVLFLAIYVGNLASIPPSMEMVGASGLLLWLFVAWGFWVDKNTAR